VKLRKAIKRILALGTGATMVGATLFGAMAQGDLSTYPAPFVQDGKFNALIVVGETGWTTDVIGAVDIATSLQYASRTQQTVQTGTAGTVTVEGGARVDTASQPLRLGMYLNATGRTALSKTDMPTLLKDTTFQDTDGNSYTIQHRIDLPGAVVSYGRSVPSSAQNIDEPVLHINFDSNTPYYNLRLDFPTVVSLGNVTNQVVSIFGKDFTSGSGSEMSATKMTLYTAAVDQTFRAGEQATVDINGVPVTVAVLGVNTQSTTASATISINGETESLTKGQTRTLGGQRVYVRDVQAYTQPVGGGGARLFIGSEKIVLEDGQSVVKGTSSKTVDGTTCAFTQSGKVSKIAIQVTPRSYDTKAGAILEGQEFVDPVFGAFKFLLATPGATPAIDSAAKGVVKFSPSGDDRLNLKLTTKSGGAYDLGIGKGNSTSLLLRANSDLTRNFVTGTGGTVTRNDYFVLGTGEYQRILELRSLTNSTSESKIVVKDLAAGGTEQSWSFTPGATSSGSMTYDGNSYTFTVAMGSTTSVQDGSISSASITNQVYTSTDNRVDLPIHDGVSDPVGGYYNQTYSVKERTSYSVGSKADDYGNFTVVYKYVSGSSGSDVLFQATPTYTAEATTGSIGSARSLGDTAVAGTGYALSFDQVKGSSYDNRDLTPWGTLVKYNSDSGGQSIELWLPNEQQKMNVFVAPVSATATSTGATEGEITYYETTPISVGAAVLPSEVPGGIAGKNVIVVGGPCVNTAAAQLLGNPADCTTGFTEGKAMLQLFDNGGGKVALLVAGYNALDTRRAARVLGQYDTYKTAGKLKGTNVEVSGVKADFTDIVVSAVTPTV